MAPKKNFIVFPVPCAYCGVSLGRREHTWDHIVPRFRGGTSTPDNLAHCCYSCNAKKAASELKDFLASNPFLAYPRPAERTLPPPAPKRVKPKLQSRQARLALEKQRCDDSLLEAVKGIFEGNTYTPPRGAGVSKLLRGVLDAKGIKVKWLPLELT